MKVAVVAVFLLLVLRLTSWRRGEVQGVEGELEEEEVWLGGLLAHIFMVQDMNSHPLFGVDGGHKSNQVRVASFWL